MLLPLPAMITFPPGCPSPPLVAADQDVARLAAEIVLLPAPPSSVADVVVQARGIERVVAGTAVADHPARDARESLGIVGRQAVDLARVTRIASGIDLRELHAVVAARAAPDEIGRTRILVGHELHGGAGRCSCQALP